MRHRGKKIGLGLVCGLGPSGRDLKTLVKVKHINEVAQEQDKKAC